LDFLAKIFSPFPGEGEFVNIMARVDCLPTKGIVFVHDFLSDLNRLFEGELTYM
jgi:hypothetical protein